MAALIAGSGAGGGIQGLAPQARILPVRVDDGQLNIGFDRNMAEGIEYAVESGVEIINISLAFEDPYPPEHLSEAIAEAARQDVLIFAGTGNKGQRGNPSEMPASQDGVVGVAATDRNGGRASFSTAGPQVAIAAPGVDTPGHCNWPRAVMCTYQEGGTSSATALASASAALIWSAHPDWTKNQVLRTMLETADGPQGTDRNEYIGYGMVRPDRVIIDGEGTPGDAGTSPLFPTYEALIDASPEPTADPTPEAGTGPEQPSAGETEEPRDPAENQAAAENPDDSGISPWFVFGSAAVILLASALAAAYFNRRNRSRVKPGLQ
jgi:subtilisin family serine protease